MKIASILAGVAVAALTASAASAGNINQGQWTGPVTGTHYNEQGGQPGGIFNPANVTAALNAANAELGNSPISAWHAIGQSGGNIGSVGDTGSATFTLKGNVATDCAYYSGSSTNQTLNFGTIGIYADENAGPANLFNMTQNASVEINTNAAGCNTANTVKITKTDLESDNNGGYDSSVFTNKLPFSVTATYKAGNPNSAVAAQSQSWTVASGVGLGSKSHGAWKSPMSLNVNIAKPNQALLAGNYEGTVSVLISAN
ncbi:hypothetical protein [Brevundimonas sp. P7753]|uniref:hypothetical protein n=1 Tax=Brevundimonas sp. P7753 TaxID=2726982 RepID=UPI0015B7BE3A|nr:hypothetical protein [Brevundimonas sp. P7753]NWE52506.1 hypothetical protein [Brevundimonas sp. P7753]